MGKIQLESRKVFMGILMPPKKFLKSIVEFTDMYVADRDLGGFTIYAQGPFEVGTEPVEFRLKLIWTRVVATTNLDVMDIDEIAEVLLSARSDAAGQSTLTIEPERTGIERFDNWLAELSGFVKRRWELERISKEPAKKPKRPPLKLTNSTYVPKKDATLDEYGWIWYRFLKDPWEDGATIDRLEKILHEQREEEEYLSSVPSRKKIYWIAVLGSNNRLPEPL